MAFYQKIIIISNYFIVKLFIISHSIYFRLLILVICDFLIIDKIWYKYLFIVSDWDCIELSWLNHGCKTISQLEDLSHHCGFIFWTDKIVKIYHLITCNLSKLLELPILHKLFEINSFEYLRMVNYFHLFSCCFILSCWIENSLAITKSINFN